MMIDDNRCPKCGAPQLAPAPSCDACGIVFEKYWKYHPRPRPGGMPEPVLDLSAIRSPEPAAEGGGLRALLLPRTLSDHGLGRGARAVLLLILLIWGLRLIGASPDSNQAGASILHLVNLPFHEAGHVLFRPFGAFIASLGGTLGQLLMPLICALTLLLRTRDPFGAAVALWWLGENFIDIAPYINDARAGQLPLLGGNFGHSAPYGFHDWNYLLTETGLLHLDHTLAWTSHVLGAALMLLAIGWGAALLARTRGGCSPGR